MTNYDLHYLELTEVAHLLQTRKLTPVELTQALMRFTSPFNMSGSPTITLPSGFASRGTPIAFQLVGRHFFKDLLVRAGRAYQRETDWHRKHPPL